MMRHRRAIPVFLLSILSSCAVMADESASQPTSQPGTGMEQLLSMRANPAGDVSSGGLNIKNARSLSVFEAAHTFAAQTAFCERSRELKTWADSRTEALDRTFNFANILLDGGRVVPPVIEQADASFRQDNDALAVTARTTWHILEPARIVSTAPDWRAYLYLQCAEPLKPNPVLMPGALPETRSEDEAQWRAGVREGWQLGHEQALAALKLGLNRLARDYQGMLRFYYLNKNGVVSAPVLAEGFVGVRVEGRMLSVDEKIFRLTEGVQWQNPKQWSSEVR